MHVAKSCLKIGMCKRTHSRCVECKKCISQQFVTHSVVSNKTGIFATSSSQKDKPENLNESWKLNRFKLRTDFSTADYDDATVVRHIIEPFPSFSHFSYFSAVSRRSNLYEFLILHSRTLSLCRLPQMWASGRNWLKESWTFGAAWPSTFTLCFTVKNWGSWGGVLLLLHSTCGIADSVVTVVRYVKQAERKNWTVQAWILPMCRWQLSMKPPRSSGGRFF